jgi:hypothetical protein
MHLTRHENNLPFDRIVRNASAIPCLNSVREHNTIMVGKKASFLGTKLRFQNRRWSASARVMLAVAGIMGKLARTLGKRDSFPQQLCARTPPRYQATTESSNSTRFGPIVANVPCPSRSVKMTGARQGGRAAASQQTGTSITTKSLEAGFNNAGWRTARR